MDYEIGFKMLISVVMGYFWIDKRNTREDIKALEAKVNGHNTKIEVLDERVRSVKDDTRYIREHLGD